MDGSILPGYYGIEAGQSAVGDIFPGSSTTLPKATRRSHARLSAEAARQRPGESGLLALDWNNGNRTILVDLRLTGLSLGQTLHTTRAEIYRALIEATAFGARTIIERIGEYGVPVERVVCCGGIAEKNPLLHADLRRRDRPPDARRRFGADACARLGASRGRDGRRGRGGATAASRRRSGR